MAPEPTTPQTGPLLRPSNFDVDAVNAAFSTRLGGVSAPPFDSLDLSRSAGDDPGAVAENLLRFCRACALAHCPPVVQRQVHGATVTRVGGEGGVPRRGVAEREADALITGERGIAIAIQVADCVPILLWDPDAPAIAAVHAGWRGTAEDIVGETIAALHTHHGTDPRRLRAALGPAIGGARYQVGPEVVQALSRVLDPTDFAHEAEGDRPHVDLRRANTALLRRAGVPSGAVELVGGCTFEDPDLFSYRRDGPRTGRMMGVIELR
jgi:purine-nucleoside/S-methyl-5'-thioadenosine phosphorylase / adenosine deaminase